MLRKMQLIASTTSSPATGMAVLWERLVSKRKPPTRALAVLLTVEVRILLLA